MSGKFLTKITQGVEKKLDNEIHVSSIISPKCFLFVYFLPELEVQHPSLLVEIILDKIYICRESTRQQIFTVGNYLDKENSYRFESKL